MDQVIGFGGGCHWCTEAVFQSLRGVTIVEQGFIGADPPDDALSEAVRLHFDPAQIPLPVLIEIHLRTHASASDHSMRGKYRSAIYTLGAIQRQDAERALAAFEDETGIAPVTRILRLRRFRLSPPRYRDYYRSRPDAPFCRTHIDPKLGKLRRTYAAFLRPEAEG